MRSSDWSSDVCSSDLCPLAPVNRGAAASARVSAPASALSAAWPKLPSCRPSATVRTRLPRLGNLLSAISIVMAGDPLFFGPVPARTIAAGSRADQSAGMPRIAESAFLTKPFFSEHGGGGRARNRYTAGHARGYQLHRAADRLAAGFRHSYADRRDLADPVVAFHRPHHDKQLTDRQCLLSVTPGPTTAPETEQ